MSPLMWQQQQQIAAQMMYYGYPPPQMVTNEQGMVMFTYPTAMQDPSGMLMMPPPPEGLTELPPAGYSPMQHYPYAVDPNMVGATNPMMMMVHEGMQNMSIADPTQQYPHIQHYHHSPQQQQQHYHHQHHNHHLQPQPVHKQHTQRVIPQGTHTTFKIVNA